MNNIFFMKFLKGNSGLAYIKGILWILVFLSLSGAVFDVISLLYIYIDSKGNLTDSCEAAAKIHIVNQDNTVEFDDENTIREFYDKLIKNFNLDSSLIPIDSETYVRDAISVDELILFENLPANDPVNAKTFNYPTIHAIITVPIRLFFTNGLMGIDGIELRVHVDVSTEDF